MWQSPFPGRPTEDIPLSDILATAEQLAASYRPMPLAEVNEELRRRAMAIEDAMIADGYRDVELWLGREM